jgi:hypothetical protein
MIFYLKKAVFCIFILCSCYRNSTLSGDAIEGEEQNDVVDSVDDEDGEDINDDGAGPSFWIRSYWNYQDYRGSGQAFVHTLPGGSIIIQNVQLMDTIFIETDGTVAWANSYHDISEGRSSIFSIATDGEIFAGGSTDAFGAGLDDFWIKKLDGGGNILWQRTFGTSEEERNYRVVLSANEGLLAIGICRVSGVFPIKILALRLDGQGAVIWSRSYGVGDEIDPGPGVALSDGGYIISATSRSIGYGALLFRIDSGGHIVWQKQFQSEFYTRIEDMKRMGDHDVIALGYIINNLDGGWDLWISRIDSSGNVIWQRVMGSSIDDRPSGIEVTSEGGFIVAGSIYRGVPTPSIEDGLIVKLDSDGDIQWQKTYGSNLGDSIISIHELPEGGFVAGGGSPLPFTVSQSMWVIKMDENGNVSNSCPEGIGEEALLIPKEVLVGIEDINLLTAQDISVHVNDTDITPSDLSVNSDLICYRE